MSPLIFFAIFFLYWRVSSWCAWFSVSPSNTVGSSTNLLNGCSLSVVLTSVWGQVMCELLVDIWWGLGLPPSSRTTFLITPICLCCYVSFFLFSYSPIILPWIFCTHVHPCNILILYWGVVVFFSTLINKVSSLNILSFSLIHATFFLVAVWWLNL